MLPVKRKKTNTDSLGKLKYEVGNAEHERARALAINVYTENTNYGFKYFKSVAPRCEDGVSLISSYQGIWYMCVYHSALSQPEAPAKHILIRAHQKLVHHLRYLKAEKRSLPNDAAELQDLAFHHAVTANKARVERVVTCLRSWNMERL